GTDRGGRAVVSRLSQRTAAAAAGTAASPHRFRVVGAPLGRRTCGGAGGRRLVAERRGTASDRGDRGGSARHWVERAHRGYGAISAGRPSRRARAGRRRAAGARPG